LKTDEKRRTAKERSDKSIRMITRRKEWLRRTEE
jgi:hypothetical protein